MAEHAARYEGFARALTDEGYALYANDHRGHGRTAGSLDRAGHLADSHGWQRAVGDLATVTEHIEGMHPGVPIVLFGHSMGSSLARTYAREYGTGLAALILAGVSDNPGLLGLAGVTAARVEARLRGRSARSSLMDKLLFGGFNRPFTHAGKARTDFEWLSRDPEQVDAYVADPWCGFVCTTTFYADLIAGVRSVHVNSDSVPCDLPILILVGGDDPVGGERAGGGCTRGDGTNCSTRPTAARSPPTSCSGWRSASLQQTTSTEIRLIASRDRWSRLMTIRHDFAGDGLHS